MKKLCITNLIAVLLLASTHKPAYGGDLQINGVEAVIEQCGETAKKTLAQATTNLGEMIKKEAAALRGALKDTLSDPTLKTAVKDTLTESTPILKKAIKDALVESAPPILLSAAELIVTSAGIMLMYQGLKADSTIQNNDDTSTKKVNTSKLLGYGSALITIGIATIMHAGIRNFFSGQKS